MRIPIKNTVPSTLTWGLLLICPLIVLWGCRHREPEYLGISLSQWVEQLSSPLPEERIDALKALSAIGGSAKKAEDKIREVARADPDLKVRVEAITTLKNLGLPIGEFEQFYQEMTAPLFFEPTDTITPPSTQPEEEEEGAGSELTVPSTEEDLEYLRSLSAESDTTTPPPREFPEDTAKREVWRAGKMKEEVATILGSLKNPAVLAELLRSGEIEERRLAARRLAQTEGKDEAIVEALESARSDPDSVVRALAQEALKNWSRP